MNAQSDINAANTAIVALLTDLAAQTAAIGVDLRDLSAKLSGVVDTNALSATVEKVQGVQSALDDAVTSLTTEATATSTSTSTPTSTSTSTSTSTAASF
jgi:hypothetical protein